MADFDVGRQPSNPQAQAINLHEQIISDIEGRYGKCVIHVISTTDGIEFCSRLPFILVTDRGLEWKGAERFNVACLEASNGHLVFIGGRLSSGEHYSIYRLAHETRCEARALITFELTVFDPAFAAIQEASRVDLWFEAVRKLAADGITIRSDGALVL